MLVCNRADKHPEQEVLTDPLEKGRIPQGLFAHLQVLHEQCTGGQRTGRCAGPADEHDVQVGGEESSRSLPPKRISKRLVLTAADMDTPIMATTTKAQAEYINRRVQAIGLVCEVGPPRGGCSPDATQRTAATSGLPRKNLRPRSKAQLMNGQN